MLKEQPGHKRPLSISKAVIRNYKRRFTKLCMNWINFRKVCNLVQHSWVFKCPRMFGIGPNVIDLKGSSMPSWKICIPVTYPGGGGGGVSIQRGYTQGDYFSPLLFILALIPLTMVLPNVQIGYMPFVISYMISKKTTKNTVCIIFYFWTTSSSLLIPKSRITL